MADKRRAFSRSFHKSYNTTQDAGFLRLVIFGLAFSFFCMPCRNAWRFSSSPLLWPFTLFRGGDSFHLLMTFGCVFIVYCGLMFVRLVVSSIKNWSHLKTHIKQFLLCGAIAILSLTMLLFGHFITKPLEDVSLLFFVKRGNRLVEALEKYKTKNGVYPENTSQLVPEFLLWVPSTGLYGARKFQYSRYGDGYSISVGDHSLLFPPDEAEQIVYLKDSRDVESHNLRIVSSRILSEHWALLQLDSL